MKHSNQCIKCDSSYIMKIKGGSTWTGAQNYILASSIKQVFVTRYLCGNCGYSEEWVDDPKNLDLLIKKYGKNSSDSQFV